MRDVSIFSSKYQKKQRRKKIIKRILLVIIFLIVLFLVFRNPILDKVDKVKSDINKENQNKQETILPEMPIEEDPEVTPETEEEEKEEIFYNIFTTSSGEEIKVSYKEKEGEKFYEEIIENASVEGDISPKKKATVILEKDTQDLFYMDIDGNVKDITYKTYVSSKGYRESKESILNRIENFNWARNPKFLNEDTVVYLSNLPWFEERQFLYVVELEPLNHYNFQNVKGVNINLLELTAEGLKYEADGKIYFLTENFKIKTQ